MPGIVCTFSKGPERKIEKKIALVLWDPQEMTENYEQYQSIQTFNGEAFWESTHGAEQVHDWLYELIEAKLSEKDGEIVDLQANFGPSDDYWGQLYEKSKPAWQEFVRQNGFQELRYLQDEELEGYGITWAPLDLDASIDIVIFIQPAYGPWTETGQATGPVAPLGFYQSLFYAIQNQGFKGKVLSISVGDTNGVLGGGLARVGYTNNIWQSLSYTGLDVGEGGLNGKGIILIETNVVGDKAEVYPLLAEFVRKNCFD